MALSLRKKKTNSSQNDFPLAEAQTRHETSVNETVDNETVRNSEDSVEQKSNVVELLPPPQQENIPQMSGDDDLGKKLRVYSKVNDLYNETNLSLTVLMSKILDLVLKTIDAKGGSIWLLGDDGQTLNCQVAMGPDSKELSGATLQKNKGLVGWVAQFGKSSIQNQVTIEKRFGKDTKISLPENVATSILACPLKYKSELIGVIEIVQKATENSFFEITDQEFLEDICTPIGMYLKTTLTQRRQAELFKKLQLFKGVQDVLGSTMDLEQLLDLVVNKAIELLGAEVGSIWLTEENGEGIVCAYAEGPTKDQVKGIKIKRGVGIIGWVVENSKSSIVADCSKDARFSSALDKKINFATQSMISAPLVVKGECLGAIQILNKKGLGLLFNQEDLDFLSLFASSAAMYIKNAKLFASEKKAKELSVLIKISKEITATLDIDSVLLSVVNLSSDIIPYERASISTFSHSQKRFVVKAINGYETLDHEDPAVKALESLHNQVAQGKNEIVMNTLEDCGQLPPFVKDYINGKNIQSLWVIVLKDEQGDIGVLSMEATESHLVRENKKELLTLLVSQVTVALRNAELYTTIPSSKVLSSLKDRILKSALQFRQWPKERVLGAIAGVIAVIGALIFIRIPYHIETNIEVVPEVHTYYAESKSKVAKILVKEGQTVAVGQVMAVLDVSDSQINRQEKESQLQKLKAEMIKLMMDDKMADFKMKEKEIQSLDLEVSRLSQQILMAEVKAQFVGTVVSENLQDLLGKPLDFGQEIIKVARQDKVYVQFEVPEYEITHVAPEQKVKFKVFGYPNKVFDQDITLQSVAGEGKALSDKDTAKFFIARAEVENKSEVVLRPGMTGRGKITGPDESLGYVLFSHPIRFMMNKMIF